MSTSNRGFSLIELMIALAILAILALVVVPGFQTFIAKNRVVTTTNLLQGSLQLARSEAIKNGENIEFNAIDGSWDNGWLIQTVSSASSAATTLKEFDPIPSTVDITASGAIQLTFLPVGAASNSPCFKVNTDTGGGHTRYIEVIASGFSQATEVTCAP